MQALRGVDPFSGETKGREWETVESWYCVWTGHKHFWTMDRAIKNTDRGSFYFANSCWRSRSVFSGGVQLAIDQGLHYMYAYLGWNKEESQSRLSSDLRGWLGDNSFFPQVLWGEDILLPMVKDPGGAGQRPFVHWADWHYTRTHQCRAKIL